MKQWPAYLAIT